MSVQTPTLHVAVVSGGLGNPSSTGLLADQLTGAAVAAAGRRGVRVEVTRIELRPLAHALADALLTGFPTGDLAEAVDRVREADAVIAVTPVFQASYAGLFKTFLDILEPDALAGTPVLMGATAGTARHSLVLEHALRPVFAYLRAATVPTAVFAAGEDFGSTADGSLAARVQRAGEELAALAAGVRHETPGATSSAGAEVQASSGELPEPTPFEEMLARI